jgi:hypothetical protein
MAPDVALRLEPSGPCSHGRILENHALLQGKRSSFEERQQKYHDTYGLGQGLRRITALHGGVTPAQPNCRVTNLPEWLATPLASRCHQEILFGASSQTTNITRS